MATCFPAHGRPTPSTVWGRTRFARPAQFSKAHGPKTRQFKTSKCFFRLMVQDRDSRFMARGVMTTKRLAFVLKTFYEISKCLQPYENQEMQNKSKGVF